MKNKIYYLGWTGCIMTIGGGLFKIMHWPGAGVLITSGLIFLSFIFFPVALFSNYRGNGKKKPLLYLAIFVAVFLQIIGALFKIQHWPGSNIVLIAGTLSPILIFLPVFLYYESKSESESLNNFFSILFLLVFISVLSAFLSVRVSKTVIKSSIDTMNFTDMTNYYAVKKCNCYNILLNNCENSAFQKVEKNKRQSEELNLLINSIENSLMNGKNNNEFKDFEDQEKPSFIFFQQNKGEELYHSIVSFRKLLTGSINNDETNKYISQLLSAESYNGLSWEKSEFKQSNVAFSLLRLKTLKDNISLAEIATLNNMITNSKK